jgi:hypothetical protein
LFIWSFEREGALGLVIGLANNGIAGVPGVLRLSLVGEDDRVQATGCVDAGCPKPNRHPASHADTVPRKAKGKDFD